VKTRNAHSGKRQAGARLHKEGIDNAADDQQTHVAPDVIRGQAYPSPAVQNESLGRDQAGIIFGTWPASNFWQFSQEVDTESTYFSNLKIACEVTKMVSKAKAGFIR
jgi:hypothetical protein